MALEVCSISVVGCRKSPGRGAGDEVQVMEGGGVPLSLNTIVGTLVFTLMTGEATGGF